MSIWFQLCNRWSVILGCIAVSSFVGVTAQRRPTFRVGVDLVTLNVTVSGADGRPVGGLNAEDFIVLEDGRPQELAHFSRATTGLSVSLLIDSSSSMYGQLPMAQQAASDFIARLRPGDVAQIIHFDSRVHVLQPFTADRGVLEAAIQRVVAGGSTSLYNAVYVSLRELETVRASTRDEIRCEVIVVLSDGEDTSSLLDFDQVMDFAKRSYTVIYTIALGGSFEFTKTRPMNGEFALRRMAQETGGRLYKTKEATRLSGVYSEIADELTSQYVLGYLPTNTQLDGRWRQVSVRVRQQDLHARTRTGYFASVSPRRQRLR